MLNPFRLTGLVLTLVVLAFGGAKLVGALGDANDSVEEANAKGGDTSSLFHAGPLDEALGRLRDKVGADAQLLRLVVYPGYLAADVSTGSERDGRSFKISAGGQVHELPLTLNGPGRLKDNVFPLADLKPAVVERLAQDAARKEHQGLDGVTHALAWIDPVSGDPSWNVYLDGGRYWKAEVDGSRLVNPDKQARKAVDNAAKAVDSASGVADCIAAAGTDAAKIQACAGK